MTTMRPQYGGTGGSLVNWYRGKRERVGELQREVLENAMTDGADLAQEYIASRGTAKSGKRGRIETSEMHDAITYDVKPFGKDQLQGRFGWLQNRKLYFALQEGGFQHVTAKEFVEGMYALQDASDWVRKQIQEDMKEGLKNA